MSAKYTDFEAFRRSTNRKLWLLLVFNLVAIGYRVFLDHLQAIRDIPVAVFDGKGQPVLFEHTVLPAHPLSDVRLEYFAEAFLKHFVALDTANLQEDYTASLNMMTDRLREIVVKEGKETHRRQGMAEANVKSQLSNLEFRIGAYDPEDGQASVDLYVWGRLDARPKFGQTETGEPYSEWFLTQMRLNRVPVTKATIFGLLVDFAETQFFNSDRDLRVELLRRS